MEADVPATIVPLPVTRAAFGADLPEVPVRDVAVLGYLYPGKGHVQVLDALDVLPAGVGMIALGRPSDGHEDLVTELGERAAARRREFEVTGYVPDVELTARLRSAVLPVAPHEHLSASGSINTWIGAGRRPLVPRSDYVEELLERAPGCVLVYDDLREGLVRAWAERGLTWAEPSGPTVQDTVAMLGPVLASVETGAPAR